MGLTHDDLEGMDIEWFAADEDGHLAYLLTGGIGPVSAGLAKSDVEVLCTFFRTKAPIRCNAIESLGWERHAALDPGDRSKAGINVRDERARRRYLELFLAMAGKGLFSFDVYEKWGTRPFYYRVAIPENALHIENLQDQIRNILERTRVSGVCFAKDSEIRPEHLGQYAM